jgi:hypothetical protein
MARMVYFPHTKSQGIPWKERAKAGPGRSFTTVGFVYLVMAFLILALGVLAASL